MLATATPHSPHARASACGIENKSGSVCGCKRQDVHIPALPNEECDDDDDDDEDFDDDEDEVDGENGECNDEKKNKESCASAKSEPVVESTGSVGAVNEESCASAKSEPVVESTGSVGAVNEEPCASAKSEPIVESTGSVGAVDVSESSASQAKASTGPANVYVNTPEENLWANRRIGLEVIGGILLYTLGSFIGIVTVSLVKCKCD
jgi:hypothetical protein